MVPDGVQWLKLPVWKVGDRGFEPCSGIQVSKKIFLPCSLVEIQYCGEPPWPRSSVLGINPPGLEIRIMSSSHLSHHLQEVLLVQFSIYLYKGDEKPQSLNFILFHFRTGVKAGATAENKKTPSLMWALFKTNGWYFMSGGACLFLYDFVILINPMILQWVLVCGVPGSSTLGR